MYINPLKRGGDMEMRSQKVDESNALLLAALAILEDPRTPSEEKAKAARIFHLARCLYETAVGFSSMPLKNNDY